jgi:hypothetical protein
MLYLHSHKAAEKFFRRRPELAPHRTLKEREPVDVAGGVVYLFEYCSHIG